MYRQWLETHDLAIEQGTRSVPGDGHFYVLQAGEVRGRFRALGDAQRLFRELKATLPAVANQPLPLATGELFRRDLATGRDRLVQPATDGTVTRVRGPGDEVRDYLRGSLDRAVEAIAARPNLIGALVSELGRTLDATGATTADEQLTRARRQGQRIRRVLRGLGERGLQQPILDRARDQHNAGVLAACRQALRQRRASAYPSVWPWVAGHGLATFAAYREWIGDPRVCSACLAGPALRSCALCRKDVCVHHRGIWLPPPHPPLALCTRCVERGFHWPDSEVAFTCTPEDRWSPGKAPAHLTRHQDEQEIRSDSDRGEYSAYCRVCQLVYEAYSPK